MVSQLNAAEQDTIGFNQTKPLLEGTKINLIILLLN